MIFDAEFDGLNPTKIHCLSYLEGSDIKTLFDYDGMRKLLLKATHLIGHNIIRFDIPHLERLLDIEIKAKATDTLMLSWYLDFDRLKHGLESWGETFGIPKPEIDDWESLTPEEYAHRCEEDVKINTMLWSHQQKSLGKLYKDKADSDRLINYLMFKMDCAREQEKVKWKLDQDFCITSLKSLQEEYDKKFVELKAAMPLAPIIKKKTRPKKPFKMDGSFSAIGKTWFDLLKSRDLPENYQGEVEVIVGYDEPKPSSHAQIKKWLYSLGWVPRNFDYKRNKETNEFRKIPQIKSAEGDGVCDSVKALFDVEPSLQVLDGLSVLSHRISILNGFLEAVDDEGYVKAEIQGLTNTFRFKHKVVVNLPGTSKPYGDIVRGCLIAPEGYELCGSDMSSLEDRTKQHFMEPYDPDYVKEMQTDDFDPHLDIALEASMMTEDQVNSYKKKDPAIIQAMYSIRHEAKQVNYSCTYGVTPEGLVRNTGMPIGQAKKLHKTYWKRNWSIQAIANDCEVKMCMGKKWLRNPLSGFWHSLRSEKDRFSTLNQGAGVYCFDTWLKFCREDGPPMVGQFHDEGIWLIRKGIRERCKAFLKEAMRKTNEKLKLNRELDCDVEFGDCYAKIH